MTGHNPAANIVGGVLLLLLDVYGISVGHLPLKGRFDTGIDLAHNPELFWAYSACLGLIAIAAILWGLKCRD